MRHGERPNSLNDGGGGNTQSRNGKERKTKVVSFLKRRKKRMHLSMVHNRCACLTFPTFNSSELPVPLQSHCKCGPLTVISLSHTRAHTPTRVHAFRTKVVTDAVWSSPLRGSGHFNPFHMTVIKQDAHNACRSGHTLSLFLSLSFPHSLA